jgi:GTP cyclohydrolase I
MKGAVRTLLECVGEDPERPGLLDTPGRVAKALEYMTHGYSKVSARETERGRESDREKRDRERETETDRQTDR